MARYVLSKSPAEYHGFDRKKHFQNRRPAAFPSVLSAAGDGSPPTPLAMEPLPEWNWPGRCRLVNCCQPVPVRRPRREDGYDGNALKGRSCSRLHLSLLMCATAFPLQAATNATTNEAAIAYPAASLSLERAERSD